MKNVVKNIIAHCFKTTKTLVADNKGNFYENNTGNTALSHGGSGDVLCGMINGFLAQGLRCFEASVLGFIYIGITAEIASIRVD